VHALDHDERGAVYTEFLVCFIPIFVLVLALVQLALLAQASLVVRYAADTAVRSAIVVLDEDPARYGGSPRRVVDRAQSSSSTGGLSGLLGGGGGGTSGGNRSRLAAIRSAAYRPLLAIAPSASQLAPSSRVRTVMAAIGQTGPLDRTAFGLVYLTAASAITFPDAPGATQHRSSFGEDAPVTVRVTYAYPCMVPIASAMLCDSWLELSSRLPMQTDSLLGPRGGVEGTIATARRLQAQRARLESSRARVDELSHSERPGTLIASIATGARFAIFSAEATLPLQSAPYRYQSEVSP
jgi:hypothetical protein